MIVELGMATAIYGAPFKPLPDPVAEQAKVKQLMIQKVVIDIEKEKEKAAEIAEQAKKAEEEFAAAQAAVAELKAFFVEPARYSAGSAGNSYVWGNCTWYAKSQRPDIGNRWGNAANWARAAAAEGFSVGREPKIGAIGVTTAGWAGHVFIVEGMSRDKSTITLSEMNYAGGVGKVNVRTISSAGFSYIYNLE